MYFTASVAIAILAFADSIIGAPTCQPNPTAASAAGAVYFITNAKHNSVVSIPIGANGLLSGAAVLTPTGGMGLGGMKADGTAAIPDSLFAQGTVRVVDDLLFTVDPGSNTVSMFQISQKNPSQLTMIGKPQSTGGEFPISVTYSSTLNIACVVNGGAVDGVSCFSVDKNGLHTLDASPRPLGLAQKTPAVGPPGTVSHISFSQDSSALIVTVKGNPAIKDTGFVAIYPVSYGVVSRHATKSSPAGTALPFGISNVSAGNFIIADPSVGGAILSIDPKSLQVSTSSAITVAGQVAICWSAFSPVTKSAYLADAGVNRIVEVDGTTGAIVAQVGLTNGNKGMFDIAASGNFLYALSPTANSTHIVVMDISGGKGSIKEAQNFEVVGLGLGTVMGLQVYATPANMGW
ncbi:hypothetical protein Q9L58_006289 [Maublancomyces gigas]|uniref:3-carboxymuconate cyclase n=1 Tax=Discina gigas TaxID=1032678 RepID=A0ABR3GFR1_9PEZI